MRKPSRSLLDVLLLGATIIPATSGHSAAVLFQKKVVSASNASTATPKPPSETPSRSVYDFSLPATDGRSLPVASFKGRTILVVNLARQSSYGEQLAALGKLSRDFEAKGLTVIGVPSNDFGAGEPGTDAEVAAYYTAQKLPFPIMARSSLRGISELPLFTFLATSKDIPPGGEVHWNYTKFLIDSKGKVVARFDPDVTPDSPELRATVEQVLSGTFAAPKKSEPDSPAGEDADDAQ